LYALVSAHAASPETETVTGKRLALLARVCVAAHLERARAGENPEKSEGYKGRGEQ